MSKKIEVVLNSQRLIAYNGTTLVFDFSCVLGDEETPTRPGMFHITWKDIRHVSSQSGHPMPYAMFFDGGRAIHAGTHIGLRHLAMRAGLGRLDNITPESAKIGSHGCVNLHKDDAAKLYPWADIGTIVVVR